MNEKNVPDECNFPGENLPEKPIYDAWGASRTYNLFRIRQPQIDEKGLWEKDGTFYVLCPNCLEETSDTGKPLVKWFNRELRPVGSLISLTSELPVGCRRVSENSSEDLIQLKGASFSYPKLHKYLSMQLGPGFPAFHLDVSGRKKPLCRVTVERQLTPSELLKLQKAIQHSYVLQVHVDSSTKYSFEEQEFPPKHSKSDPENAMELIPSAYIPKRIAPELRWQWEEDEEFWFENRGSIISSENPKPESVLPDYYSIKKSRAILDCSVFPIGNLRNYLTVSDEVVIGMPIASKFEQFLHLSCVKTDELISLARIGRVRFLLPLSLDRYPLDFLQRLSVEAQTSLLFSRRLAAATILDSRRRNPLLYAPFIVRERKIALEVLLKVAGSEGISEFEKTFFFELANTLKRIWSSFEYQINFRGAVATGWHGIGALVDLLFKVYKNQDFAAETFSAVRPVEWAGFLNGTVFPYDSTEYSEQNITEAIASVYTGFENKVVPNGISALETVIDGLLTINNDAPILELSEVFDGKDVQRFRNVAFDMAQKNQDTGFLDAEIDGFNKKVKRFEGKTAHLKSLDILGLLAAAICVSSGEQETLKYIPMGLWIWKLLFNYIKPDGMASRSQILDSLNAANTFTSSDVVMVSRLKSSLRNRGLSK